MAAVDYFLKLDGIEGESTDDKHKGEINIESFSWGVSNNTAGAAGGGGAAGKVQVQDFHFTMATSKASPNIFKKAVTGGHLKSAVLSGRKAGDVRGPNDFLKITLTDVLVSSYQVGSSGGGVPTDSLSVNFTRIEFEYIQQSPTGVAGASTKAGYDLKLNKAI